MSWLGSRVSLAIVRIFKIICKTFECVELHFGLLLLEREPLSVKVNALTACSDFNQHITDVSQFFKPKYPALSINNAPSKVNL